MKNDHLDFLDVLRLALDSIDALAEGLLRESGSVESQKAAGLARRARMPWTASRLARSSERRRRWTRRSCAKPER